MASALRQFHATNYPAEHARLSRNGTVDTSIYFEGLAWEGLSNVDVEAWNKIPVFRKRALLNAADELVDQATKDCKE